MRYRAYKKSITREILSSKARFASILVIILLGVAFFSGIKSSGPDMNKAINELYKNQNLMDSKIVSTLGLTDKDLDLLKNNDKILDFYSSHTIDANLENINSVVRFMEYDRNNIINDFIKTSESETEKNMLNIIKYTLISEISEASKEVSEASWLTESTYDDDGYSNDDGEEVIYVDIAVNIIESVIYDNSDENNNN